MLKKRALAILLCVLMVAAMVPSGIFPVASAADPIYAEGVAFINGQTFLNQGSLSTYMAHDTYAAIVTNASKDLSWVYGWEIEVVGSPTSVPTKLNNFKVNWMLLYRTGSGYYDNMLAPGASENGKAATVSISCGDSGNNGDGIPYNQNISTTTTTYGFTVKYLNNTTPLFPAVQAHPDTGYYAGVAFKNENQYGGAAIITSIKYLNKNGDDVTTAGAGFEPYVAGGNPFYDLQQDNNLSVGTNLGSYLSRSYGGTIGVTGSVGSWIIGVTGRNDDGHALDIKINSGGLPLRNGYQYSFEVEGTAPSGTKMKIVNTTDYGGIGTAVYANASNEFSIVTPAKKYDDLSSFSALRIQTENGGTVNITVTKIIVNETPIPAGTTNGDIISGTGISKDTWGNTNPKTSAYLVASSLAYADQIEGYEIKISSADVSQVVLSILLQGNGGSQGYGNSGGVAYKGSAQSVTGSFNEIRNITADGIVAGYLASGSAANDTQQFPFSSTAATQYGRFRIVNELETGEDFKIEYIAFIGTDGKYLLNAVGAPAYQNGTAFDTYKDTSKMPDPGSNSNAGITDYKLSEDADIAATRTGVTISSEGTSNLKLAGDPTITVVANASGGKSLKVETPVNASGGRDYFGLDIKGGASGVAIDKDANYTVLLTGHVDAAPSSSLGLEMQTVYKDAGGVEKYSGATAATFTGTNFTLLYEVKPSILTNYGDFLAFRIKHKQGSTTYISPYYIDDIVITHTGGSGGGSSSGNISSGGDVSSSPEPATSAPSTVTVTTTVNEEGTASAQVSEKALASLIATAMAPKKPGEAPKANITIDVGAVAPDTKAVSVSLPASSISQIANETKVGVSINTGLATLTLDTKALQAISGADTTENNEIKLSVTVVDKQTLPENELKKIGDRPVFDFSVTNGETQVSDFNGGKINISIPYVLGDDEKPNAVVIYYIDDSGKVKQMMGKYDAATGTVNFTATHFSVYAVGYNFVEFSDINVGTQSYDAVTFLAARDITNGVGGGRYGLAEKITRAQFIVMLMRAFGLEPDENSTVNFADAGNTWYTGYLSSAKQLGISEGKGDNKFAPEDNLTEWELQTFLSRTLEKMECPPYAVRESADKTLKVSRSEVAKLLYSAINNGFFNVGAANDVAELEEVTIYSLANDSQITESSDGKAITGTVYLQNCATTLTVRDYEGGKSLEVSGRTDDWRGLDIKQESIKLQADKKYTFVIKGHTSGSIPEGATIKLSATDSSGKDGSFVETDLTKEFTLEIADHIFDADTIKNKNFYRINTTGAAGVTLIIDSILITTWE